MENYDQSIFYLHNSLEEINFLDNFVKENFTYLTTQESKVNFFLIKDIMNGLSRLDIFSKEVQKELLDLLYCIQNHLSTLTTTKLLLRSLNIKNFNYKRVGIKESFDGLRFKTMQLNIELYSPIIVQTLQCIDNCLRSFDCLNFLNCIKQDKSIKETESILLSLMPLFDEIKPILEQSDILYKTIYSKLTIYGFNSQYSYPQKFENLKTEEYLLFVNFFFNLKDNLIPSQLEKLKLVLLNLLNYIRSNIEMNIENKENKENKIIF